MKAKTLLLFITILIQACTAQKQIPKKTESNILNQTNAGRAIDTKDTYDVILADIKKGSILSIPFGLDVFNEKTHFFDLSLQSIPSRGILLTDKNFHFYNEKDDMKIKCKCRKNKNYYIKNLKVKEGKYTLTYNKTIKIKGDKINVSDSIQNTLFKNMRLNQFKDLEDIYFKDLEFVVLDLADTLNVKLKKVN